MSFAKSERVAMDPNATLRIIHGATSQYDEEAVNAANDLRHWLIRGGFAPDWSQFPRGAYRYRKIMCLRPGKDY